MAVACAATYHQGRQPIGPIPNYGVRNDHVDRLGKISGSSVSASRRRPVVKRRSSGAQAHGPELPTRSRSRGRDGPDPSGNVESRIYT